MAQVVETEEPTVVREREVVRDEAPRRSSAGLIGLILLILIVLFVLFSWCPWSSGGSGATTNVNVPTPTTSTGR